MRAQVTMFIIIGIVILAAFVLVFYAASIVTTEERASREYLASQPLSDYITSCLEEGAREVIPGYRVLSMAHSHGKCMWPRPNGPTVVDIEGNQQEAEPA